MEEGTKRKKGRGREKEKHERKRLCEIGKKWELGNGKREKMTKKGGRKKKEKRKGEEQWEGER